MSKKNSTAPAPAPAPVKRGKGRPKGSLNAVKSLAVGATGYTVDLAKVAKLVKENVYGPVTVVSATESVADGKQFTLDNGTLIKDGDTMLFRDLNAVAKAVIGQLV
jgi:hypothetical protein